MDRVTLRLLSPVDGAWPHGNWVSAHQEQRPALFLVSESPGDDA